MATLLSWFVMNTLKLNKKKKKIKITKKIGIKNFRIINGFNLLIRPIIR